MKSYGQNTHISLTISKALNQVSPPTKPATGASMPEKKPEKRSKSAPPKSNKNLTEKQSPNKPPARSPGRPRSNRIESFNTDSFLRQNRKFIKLKRKLNISEEKTWTIITSMFCYVARSEALTPIINDVELFAEFCYWNDEPQILINALISVNFLTKTPAGTFSENLEVSSWFQNQPHAARKLHDHNATKNKKITMIF